MATRTISIPLNLRVSNHRNIGVLAHYQPLGVRPTTHVPREAADDLVRRMICERISAKVIRMLPPESVCLAATRADRPAAYPVHDLPADDMPGDELPGIYFQDPNPARSRSPLAAAALPTQLIAPELLAGNSAQIYWLVI